MPEKGKAHPDVLGALRKEGKDYVLPSSAWYVTPGQAEGYLRLSNSESYKKAVHEPELKLLDDHIRRFLPLFKDVRHVVDLGCGDGKKAISLINALKGAGAPVATYHPLDASWEMLGKAVHNAMENYNSNIAPINDDLSSLEKAGRHFSQFEGRKMFLLLGNTIGNFDMAALLPRIKKIMKKGDLLYIGASFTTDSPEELVRSYSDPKVLKWMAETGHALGLDDKDFGINVEYNLKKSAIELFLDMKRDKEVGSGERKVRFKAGDRIRAAVSYHYPFLRLINEIGKHFQVDIGSAGGGNKYMLFTCEKT